MSTMEKLDKWAVKLDKDRAEKRVQILDALKKTEGNISAAALIVGLDRSRMTIYVRQLGLKEEARKMRQQAGVSKSGQGRPWK